MKRNANSWSAKEIIKGKTLFVIILTILLTKLFTHTADNALTHYLNKYNDHPLYTYNYSFGTYGLLLIIPALLISIFAIKLFLTLRKTPNNQSSKNKRAVHRDRFRQEKRFKWYAIYGVVLGYLFLAYGALPFIDSTTKKITNDNGQVITSLIAFIIATAAILYLVSMLNKSMVKKTNTNNKLIHNIRRGLYNPNIAKSGATKNEIIKELESGWATTYRGALFSSFIRRTLIKIGRAILSLTKGYLKLCSKIVFSALRAGGSSETNGGGSSGPQVQGAYEDQKAKDDADWNVKQKERQARYDLKHAEKQVNYNSLHAGNNLNRTKHSIHELTKAKRERRDLDR